MTHRFAPSSGILNHGLQLGPGDEILTTEHDYYATYEALRQVSDLTGATIRTTRLFDRHEDASEQQIVDRIRRAITPREEELSAGIVCFDVDGRSPEAVVDRLAQRDIVATTTPYARPYPRLTPSIYNTSEEVDTVLRAMREVA